MNTIESIVGIVGIIIGAILTGVAMILNSYFSVKFSTERANLEKKQERLEKEIVETGKFYENILHLSDKLIRNKGVAEKTELEEFYKQGITLKLISVKEIIEKFCEFKSDICGFAHKLSRLPEEFIPSFEGDDDRRYRLEERKKVIQKREKEAEEYVPSLYHKYSELADLMKKHLQSLKDKI